MNIRTILKELRRKRKCTTLDKVGLAFRKSGWIKRRTLPEFAKYHTRNVPEKGQVIKRTVGWYIGQPCSLPATSDYYTTKVYDSKGNLVVFKAY